MLSKTDLRWYEVATHVASEQGTAYRHCALIVKSGRVLAIATNKYGSSRFSRKLYNNGHTNSLHAELRAIIKAGASNVIGATLYSARHSTKKACAISKPCRVCAALIEDSGIKTIVYSDGNQIIKESVK